LYFATSHHETGDAFACVTNGFALSTDANIDSGVAHSFVAAFCSIALSISPCLVMSEIDCTFAFHHA